MTTPFSCAIERNADLLRLTLLHSTDAGPARTFTAFLDIDIDETHATILFGELGLALQEISDARASATVIPFPAGRKGGDADS